MLMWRRNGIVVPIFTFVSMLALDYFTGRASGDGYYSSHVWPKVVAFLIAAALVFLVDRAMESDDDHFFFVPLRFWPAILVIGGTVLSIVLTDAAPVPSASS